MNIIQVMSGSYPPKEGVGSHVFSISETLVNCGHSVQIVVRDYNIKKVTIIRDSGVEIVLIPIRKIPFISTFLFKKKVENYFINKIFDIVHFHSPLVPFINLNTRKNILTIHSTMKVDTTYIEAISINAMLNKIMGKFLSPIIEGTLLKNADQVIVVSHDIKDELREEYSYTKDNILYIPNGIDKDIFYNMNLNKKKQIVYIGRLGYRKGLPVLIQAINEISDYLRGSEYNIILSGEGHLKNYLLEQIDKNNLSDLITITSTKQVDVNKLLNESMFLIMNSTYETGPRTVLESMFSNTPVIATKVGLLRYFNDDDYIRIDAFDKDSVIEAIRRAINLDIKSYENFQTQHQIYINEFNIKKVTNYLIAAYEG